MDGKALLKSKTFWVNAVGFLLIILQATNVVAGVDYVSLEAGLLGIVNIVLRLITKEPITSVVVSPEQKAG